MKQAMAVSSTCQHSHKQDQAYTQYGNHKLQESVPISPISGYKQILEYGLHLFP